MATGKPVIASNLPGVRSVVDDRKNGLLVIPKDPEDLACKINQILDNGDIASNFGINGRKKVEEMYSWGMVTKKLEQQMLALIRKMKAAKSTKINIIK
jgi:glycosyltransferase involved in cell wall biosynthesis